MNKIAAISELNDIQSLTTLISKIAQEMKLSKINNINDNEICATEESTLGDRKIRFICTLSELNGKVRAIRDFAKDGISDDDNFIIVSSHKKKISNYFREWLQNELETDKIQYWENGHVIKKIDDYLPEYWGHNDMFLKTFEDSFISSLGNQSELQQVLKLDKKFEELLNIFIEPKIYRFKEDPKTERQIRVRFNLEKYLDGQNYFISGDAGTGKSTLLKEIGKLAIENNNNTLHKILPIRLKTSLIANLEYSINKSIEREISNLIGNDSSEKVFEDYNVILLLDSIDEFETDKQKQIFQELKQLYNNRNLNFVLATRNYESLTKNCIVPNHIHTKLANFDLNQVKNYLSNFFKKDLKKSEDLWDSLLHNKILERIPPTPLTISLISVLYEENGYEIPATLTDVYDNFNAFLLGRLSVNSRLDFLKINVKEKILSMYALEVIQNSNRSRMKIDTFTKYIVDYFKEQSITIEDNVIPEMIKGMTDGTGVLTIDEQDYVTYHHDHFMEYYASREIFNRENRSELEEELIQKFTEYNWQNTTIFYTGRTKDMKLFLGKLVDRVYEYNLPQDQLLAVSGLGYVIQSLWMTNSNNRKDAVMAALDLLLKVDSGVKLLAEKKFPFFRGVKDTDIAMANLVWFQLHFNSITLYDPLKLAFEDLHQKVRKYDKTVFGSDKITYLYKLFCIAATLNTGRLRDSKKLDILFNEDKLLTIPLFVFLFDEAIEILEYHNDTEIRKNFKLESKKVKYTPGIRFYLDNPSEELSHTHFLRLNPVKKFEIFTEGVTDASIMHHAYRVLTYDSEPYWNITATENIGSSSGGGAHQLSQSLIKLSEKIETDNDKEKVVVGIFDNDSKGFQEFNGLPANFRKENGLLKKHSDFNIYALLLPIPENPNYNQYHQNKQVFKFFEIEHYFPKIFLEENNMITETSIPNVDEITGNKTKFKDLILQKNDEGLFKEFVTLFQEIDSLCGKAINYIEKQNIT